ncbi:MAG: D-Ala-D-Ala carboxypeptidase family metallohydrolase [Nanoarchaeota archaeon]
MKGFLLTLLAGMNLNPLETRISQEPVASQPFRNYLDFRSLERYIVPEDKVPEGCKDPLNSGNPLYNIESILAQDPEIQLTENFKLKEFARTDDNLLSYIRLNPKIPEALQRLRNHLGRPITIVSAYRPPWRQEELKQEEETKDRAAKVSKHSSGNAVDIQVEGIKPSDLRGIIRGVLGNKVQVLTYQGSKSTHLNFSNY